MKSVIGILAVFGVLNLPLSVSGQTSLTITNLSMSNNSYSARDEVIVEPTSNATPGPNMQVRIFTNKELQLTGSYQSNVNLSNNVVSTPINKNLPVGAIKGNFSVSESGQSSYDIPIYIPPGTNGMIPTVGIKYNSSSVSGIVGRGWDIRGISAIMRSPKDHYRDNIKSGIQLNSTDAFVLNGVRLIGNGPFYPEDDIHTRVTLINGDYFKVEAKNGLTYEYGNTADSKLMMSTPSVPLIYYINRVVDNFGNEILYEYYNSNNEIAIKEIKYTRNLLSGISAGNSIKFYYDTRSDQSTKYVLNNQLVSTLILREIEVKVETKLTKLYKFIYGFNGQSYLNEIKEYGDSQQPLNSTLFGYGTEPTLPSSNQTLATSSPQWAGAFLPDAADYRVGDFNGDGLSDLLAFPYSSINQSTNYKTYTGWTLYINTPGAVNHGWFFEPIASETISNFVPYGMNDYFGFSPHPTMDVLDYNNDGMDDMVIAKPFSGQDQIWVYLSNGVGFNIPSQPIVSISPDADYCFADLNGDNLLELVVYDLGFFRIVDLVTGSSFYPQSGTSTTPCSGSVGQPYEGLRAVDFNGDGINEIMSNRNSQYQVIIKFNLNNGAFTSFTSTEINCVPQPSAYQQHLMGDLNGDGNVDMIRVPCCGSNNTVKVKFGKGIDFTSEINIPNSLSSSDKRTYLVADVNLDGRSDLICLAYTTSNGRITIYLVNGDQLDSFTEIGHINAGFPDIRDYYYEALSGPVVFETYHDNIPSFYIGDFNGDGHADVFYKNWGNRRIIYLQNGTPHLLSNITDGYRNNINVQYKSLKPSADNFYTKGSGSNFPIMDYQGAFWVVSKVNEPNGIGGISATDYKYEAAKVHLQGKGFLGFEKIITTNSTLNRKTIKENQLNGTYFELIPYKNQIYSLDNNTLISQKEFTTSFLSFGTSVLHFTKIDNWLETDFISGNTCEKIFTYNGNGIITNEVINVSNGFAITENDYTIESTPQGSWVAWKPTNVSNTITRFNEPPITRQTSFEYNLLGQLYISIQDPQLSEFVKTTHSYYNTGVLHEKQIESPNLPTKIFEYFYDSKYRFVTRVKNPLNQFVESNFDAKWGKPIWEKTISGLITYYSYDEYGRSIIVKTPDNVNTYIAYNWVQTSEISGGDPVDISNSLYSIETSRAGSPGKKELFDAMGRNTRTEKEGWGNNKVYSANSYNARGLVNFVCSTYELSSGSGFVPTVTENLYDDFNRMNEIIVTDGAITKTTVIEHTFDNGNYTITTTTPDFKTYSKTTDPVGKQILVEDDGGIVTYQYNSSGQLKSTSLNGLNLNTLTYDVYGKQNLLNEKNSGETIYQYNAYNKLVYQEDANGVEYEFEYDALDRLTEKTGPEGTYLYQYVTNGYGLNLIQSIDGPNNVSYEYAYDYLDRVVKSIETIEGQEFITEIEYDQFSNIIKKTFPSGYAIGKTYDEKGYQTQITSIDDSQIIWQMDEITPIVTKYTMGNGIQTIKNYSNTGLPLSYISNNILELEFNFDEVSKNLLTRMENYPNSLSESFNYDPLNRLEEMEVNGLTALNISYQQNGNISNKTEIGNYAYDPLKLNAVTSVENILGLVSPNEQIITYTNFNKVESINEGSYAYSVLYGPDDERKKVEMLDQGILEYTRYYTGDYEMTNENGNTIEVHYIDYGAIYVRINGVGNMFYTYSDHLGSILAVTDESGLVIARQNFDAWGNKRNPMNWEYSNIPSIPSWLYRGFTGHEHLQEFGLINMNGRLYDPQIGRMLSPDNYVQDPGSSQSYNKYSYCFNNPLKFTDPSGQFALWDDIIVAGVGFAFGYVSYGITNNDWGSDAVVAGGITAGTALLGYYTGGGSLAGGTVAGGSTFATNFVVNSAISLVVPSINIPVGNYLTYSIGPSYGLGPNGFMSGFGGSWTYSSGDVTFSYAFGVRGSANGGYETRASFGGIYSGNDQNISLAITKFGGTDPQAVWHVGYEKDGFSFAMDNDVWLSGDKYRTAAVELGMGDYRGGFSIYTNRASGTTDADKPDEWSSETWGCNKFGKGTYVDGKRIYSGAYIGYNNGTTVFRAGINDPRVQDLFQNGLHRIIGSSYFKTDYETNSRPYFVYSSFSPFTLY
ncbi:MAG TPA: FG-GAP-like repeat-containing protein [Bacteroidia bacterium]|nr:FG-GAP-like repeat-containing protein [Bacteroidia bacterium]